MFQDNLRCLGWSQGDQDPLLIPLQTVDFDRATAQHAFDRARRPGFRQGGKEMDFSGIGADEHLDDHGGRSSIAKIQQQA